jgi:pyruvate dehydrogenase E2 component (dihydrolipoamide acetyltransferase)
VTTDVTMPQLGETVAEGTVTRWLKGIGDRVEENEALLEVSTDKVETEVVSPASGTLVEIVIQEDVTVDVGAVIARIETVLRADEVPGAHLPEPSSGNRHTHSPRVRRLAHEHGVELVGLNGSGPGARVTPDDVMAEAGRGVSPQPSALNETVPATQTEDRLNDSPERPRPVPNSQTQPSRTTDQAPNASDFDAALGTRVTVAVEVDVSLILGTAHGTATAPTAASMLADVGVVAVRQLTASTTWTTFRSMGVSVTDTDSQRVVVIDNARDLARPALLQRVGEAVAGQANPVSLDGAQVDLLLDAAPAGLLWTARGGFTAALRLSLGTPIERPVVVQSEGLPSAIGIRWMAYLSLTFGVDVLTESAAALLLLGIKRALETTTDVAA